MFDTVLVNVGFSYAALLHFAFFFFQTLIVFISLYDRWLVISLTS